MTGSILSVGAKKDTVASATVSFLLQVTDGLEPIAAEVSGGHFLQPVQTLVATLIFSPKERKCISSPTGGAQKHTKRCVFYLILIYTYTQVSLVIIEKTNFFDIIKMYKGSDYIFVC